MCRAGVVGGVRRRVGPGAQREVGLVGGEHRAVEEVDALAVVGLVGHDLADRGGQLGEVVEADVAQPDERPHRLEVDDQPQRVAQRAVGVGQGAEQVAVLTVGPGDDDLAGTGQHLDLAHRLVRQAEPERARLDAEPAERAADGDGLELGHDRGHQAVGKRRVDEVLVRRHGLDVGGPRDGVDGQHASSPETSRPGAALRSRGRNRLDVRLASRTGAPGGIAAYCRSSRSRAWAWRAPTCTPSRAGAVVIRSPVSRGRMVGRVILIRPADRRLRMVR